LDQRKRTPAQDGHDPNFQTFGTAKLASRVATAGFLLYGAFAPHSIAAAEISLAIVGAGWLLRALVTGRTGFRRTVFDIPIWLFFFWTVLSSFLSAEPRISIAKIQSTCVVLLFYLTQAILTRRTAVMVVTVMILSGSVGTLYSFYDLARGRGVLVQSIAPDSPFNSVNVQPGDAIWRVGGKRVYSLNEIDERLRQSTIAPLTISVISQGEHVERPGLTLTDAQRKQTSPSGIAADGPTHSFRASGWTRHYETYAEIIQVLAQLALGLAIANFKNHRLNVRAKLAWAAYVLLAIGIALTAMRTVLVALVIGLLVIALRTAGKRTRVLAVAGICLLLATGIFVVYRTRAPHALALQDPSSELRMRVARIGLGRILMHPVFGHGMDAMHLHWQDWGFPGSDMLHLHSTPLQIAFDRGLPALAMWLWIMWLFWRTTSRAEMELRDSSETNRYGVLLGATGAVAGFFVSALVNYNFGDGEVALVFWWLMGTLVVLAPRVRES